jgi:hypothetical protein
VFALPLIGLPIETPPPWTAVFVALWPILALFNCFMIWSPEVLLSANATALNALVVSNPPMAIMPSMRPVVFVVGIIVLSTENVSFLRDSQHISPILEQK